MGMGSTRAHDAFPILMFANNSVHWECRECYASQGKPNFVRRMPDDDAKKTPTHPKKLIFLMRDFCVEGSALRQGGFRM